MQSTRSKCIHEKNSGSEQARPQIFNEVEWTSFDARKGRNRRKEKKILRLDVF